MSESAIDTSAAFLAVPYILKLPDEILLRIFEYLPCELTSYKLEKKYEHISLSFVCRRFNSIITPLIYQNVEFNTTSIPKDPSTLLHRSLQENPLLRRHVRALVLRLEEGCPVEIASDLSTWLPSVKRLVVGGKFWGMPRTWPIALSALRHMPKLEHLILGSDYNGPCLPPIFEIVGRIPTLKVLELRGVSEIRGAPWYKRVKVQNWRRPHLTPPWAALGVSKSTLIAIHMIGGADLM